MTSQHFDFWDENIRQYQFRRFQLRTLLAVQAVIALLAVPAYWSAKAAYEIWTAPPAESYVIFF